jgi:hypothetical protein
MLQDNVIRWLKNGMSLLKLGSDGVGAEPFRQQLGSVGLPIKHLANLTLAGRPFPVENGVGGRLATPFSLWFFEAVI